MIPAPANGAKRPRHRNATLRDTSSLLSAAGLDLHPDALPDGETAGFPVRVPAAFAARIRRGDTDDPLLRQVLPTRHELAEVPGYGPDPLGEQRLRDGSGLLRKYRGRALLVTTGACAIHCRYCFRREFPYGDEAPAASAQARALEQIRRDTSIREVILSGGDPLSLSNRRLGELLAALEAIAHVARLRMHTRTAVAAPERVDAELLQILRGVRRPLTIVVHCNHARELDEAARAALSALRGTGATLLNQAVLLAGVNDSAAAQIALAEALHETGVLPYYLHLLDTVSGAAHFAVDESRARALMREMHAALPGYLVPRLVRERPGEAGKTWIDWT